MKRNRNSFSYRFRHWFHIRGWEELGIIIFEIITGIVFFAALFFLPHLFH